MGVFRDADQFYDLKKDPFEQDNIADENNPDFQRLRHTLFEHLAGFKHPFEMAVPAFRRSEHYRRLVDKTRQLTPESIPWFDPESVSRPPVM